MMDKWNGVSGSKLGIVPEEGLGEVPEPKWSTRRKLSRLLDKWEKNPQATLERWYYLFNWQLKLVGEKGSKLKSRVIAQIQEIARQLDLAAFGSLPEGRDVEKEQMKHALQFPAWLQERAKEAGISPQNYSLRVMRLFLKLHTMGCEKQPEELALREKELLEMLDLHHRLGLKKQARFLAAVWVKKYLYLSEWVSPVKRQAGMNYVMSLEDDHPLVVICLQSSQRILLGSLNNEVIDWVLERAKELIPRMEPTVALEICSLLASRKREVTGLVKKVEIYRLSRSDFERFFTGANGRRLMVDEDYQRWWAYFNTDGERVSWPADNLDVVPLEPVPNLPDCDVVEVSSSVDPSYFQDRSAWIEGDRWLTVKAIDFFTREIGWNLYDPDLLVQKITVIRKALAKGVRTVDDVARRLLGPMTYACRVAKGLRLCVPQPALDDLPWDRIEHFPQSDSWKMQVWVAVADQRPKEIAKWPPGVLDYLISITPTEEFELRKKLFRVKYAKEMGDKKAKEYVGSLQGIAYFCPKSLLSDPNPLWLSLVSEFGGGVDPILDLEKDPWIFCRRFFGLLQRGCRVSAKALRVLVQDASVRVFLRAVAKKATQEAPYPWIEPCARLAEFLTLIPESDVMNFLKNQEERHQKDWAFMLKQHPRIRWILQFSGVKPWTLEELQEFGINNRDHSDLCRQLIQ